jgi:hypothetical protein
MILQVVSSQTALRAELIQADEAEAFAEEFEKEIR